MKKIYFVRHGESDGNIGKSHQEATSSLTEKGRGQANFIAERCTKLLIELVISSTMNRAKQTAEVIVEKISKPIEYSDLFSERRRPKEQLGSLRDDPKALEAQEAITKNFAVPGFRFSDEENFDDLKERAGKALAHLKDRPESNILVVTHSFFMTTITAYAIFGEDLTALECRKFADKFHMENTGITILGFEEKGRKSPWWLWVWNDHTHLG